MKQSKLGNEGLTVSVSAAELAEIAAVLPRGSAAGERYPASMMAFINR